MPSKATEKIFDHFGWEPHEFQREAWAAYEKGKNLLVHVPTGTGKTWAALGGPLNQIEVETKLPSELKILYITPLRALSADIESGLKQTVSELKWKLRVESRTADTKSYRRKKQIEKPPHLLLTTPESLNLLLTYDQAPELFRNLSAVIVDEWHELMGSKRGVQTLLALEHLRNFSPDFRTIGLSATLKNADQAARVLIGSDRSFSVVTTKLTRSLRCKAILPTEAFALPWSGHRGLKLFDYVMREIDIQKTQLLFTNTRSQAELWYRAFYEEFPEWRDRLALHHGSLTQETRKKVEEGARTGTLKIIVCTSTLDLGIDFPEVDRVFQIGSIKSLHRFLQRAGRSRHRPNETSEIYFVPTQALQLLELEAGLEALKNDRLEDRVLPEKPYDVLAQHLVNLSMEGEGFEADRLFDEVKRTYPYRHLERAEFDQILLWVEKGGQTLNRYPQYQKLKREEGRFRISNDRLALLHRMNIGTIASDASVTVKFLKGGTLGTVEESFISRFRPGDHFIFSGRMLSLVRLKDMQAFVRLAKGGESVVTMWPGGQLPISRDLSASLRNFIDRLAKGEESGSKNEVVSFLEPVLKVQKRLSLLPRSDELLVEVFTSREGLHCFIYAMEGSFVNEALGAILAYRFSLMQKATLTVSANDFGVELLAEDYPFDRMLRENDLFSPEGLVEDVVQAVNLSEIRKRLFRGIARVGGLVFQNFPGHLKSSRQLQASSSLIFDVLEESEPEHLFLQQSKSEALKGQFEFERLTECFERLSRSTIRVVKIEKPTPFCFSLMTEKKGLRISSESIEERFERVRKVWNKILEN